MRGEAGREAPRPPGRNDSRLAALCGRLARSLIMTIVKSAHCGTVDHETRLDQHLRLPRPVRRQAPDEVSGSPSSSNR